MTSVQFVVLTVTKQTFAPCWTRTHHHWLCTPEREQPKGHQNCAPILLLVPNPFKALQWWKVPLKCKVMLLLGTKRRTKTFYSQGFAQRFQGCLYGLFRSPSWAYGLLRSIMPWEGIRMGKGWWFDGLWQRNGVLRLLVLFFKCFWPHCWFRSWKGYLCEFVYVDNLGSYLYKI